MRQWPQRLLVENSHEPPCKGPRGPPGHAGGVQGTRPGAPPALGVVPPPRKGRQGSRRAQLPPALPSAVPTHRLALQLPLCRHPQLLLLPVQHLQICAETGCTALGSSSAPRGGTQPPPPRKAPHPGTPQLSGCPPRLPSHSFQATGRCDACPSPLSCQSPGPPSTRGALQPVEARFGSAGLQVCLLKGEELQNLEIPCHS